MRTLSTGDLPVVTGSQVGGWIAKADVVEDVGGFSSQLKRIAFDCDRSERSKIDVMVARSNQEVAAYIAVNPVGADAARLAVTIVDEGCSIEPCCSCCLAAAVRVQKRVHPWDTVRAISTFSVIHVVVGCGYVDRHAAV